MMQTSRSAFGSGWMMMMMAASGWCLMLLRGPHCCWTVQASSSWSGGAHRRRPSFTVGSLKSSRWSAAPLVSVRGGSAEDHNDDDAVADDDANEDDAERYSRQVYTLGAQAQSLIRSSAIYLDGPPGSGLVYETAKNLALSGVRQLVLLVEDEADDVSNNRDDDGGGDSVDNDASPEEQEQQPSIDAAYHHAEWDDLGRAYQSAARAEWYDHHDENSAPSDAQLLQHYLQRLNPGVTVSLCRRSQLLPTASLQRHVLVVLDRPAPTVARLNQWVREQQEQQQATTNDPSWAFVAAETAGVFGRVFCDFGNEFTVNDADGEMPIVTPLDHIVLQDNNDNDSTATVHCVPGEKHDVSRGDVIEFQRRDGQVDPRQCRVHTVKNPFCFTVELPKNYDDAANRGRSNLQAMLDDVNAQAASFRRVKVPQSVSFASLDQIMTDHTDAPSWDPSLFAACDLEKSFDEGRRAVCMASFRALSDFCQQHRRLPRRHQDEDELADLITGTDNPALGKAFAQTCAAKFSPLVAMFGAIAGQEAIKAATSLYFPVRQFLLYDCDEVLAAAATDDDIEPRDGTAAGLRYILGHAVVDQLQSQKLFVVGAGAIGCELLKNLAAMGAATRGKKACLSLTDMDTIEKSNLSRQLLFRDADLGDFKSSAAQRAARRFCPAMNIQAFTHRVGHGATTPFQERFWSRKVDIVLNALDNMEARLYMDGQCVLHSKALIDAGTLGPKGNVQVVVPFQSESYSSSADPPEPAIAVCTVKNFPYAISHTIQWARELFDQCFERRPETANDVARTLTSEGGIDQVCEKLFPLDKKDEDVEASTALVQDVSAMSLEQAEKKQTALDWAAALTKQLFYDAPKQLLKEHPPDSLDEDGEPFWTGTRRQPALLEPSQDQQASTAHENLMDFARTAALLRLESLTGQTFATLESTLSSEEVREALLQQYNEAGESTEGDASQSPVGDLDQIQSLLSTAATRLSSSQDRMSVLEFEKDDEANGHVAFVSAASNLRAMCYGIPPVDRMETRRIAGKIVPAMITTTAFVSALSCIELVKLSKKNLPLQNFRNAFINLALPFFAFTVPLPAEPIAELMDRSFTLWDKLTVKESRKAAAKGGMKLKKLLKKLRKQLSEDDPDSVTISSVSMGPFLLYADFLHQGDKAILRQSLWDLIQEAVDDSIEFDSDARDGGDGGVVTVPSPGDTVDLTVTVEDEDGDEIELPPVRVIRRRSSD